MNPADLNLDLLLDQLAERVAHRLHELQAGAQPAVEERSPWMSLPSAAAYLDWPRQRLYKLTATGAIPHYKHEGRLLFHRAELERWLGHYAEPTTTG